MFHRDGAAIRDFRAAWTRACDAAGFMGTLFHDVRRSGVRNLVRAGFSQKVTMAVSGHKTPDVFKRYDITDEAEIADAIDRVGAYVDRRRDEGSRVVPLRPTGTDENSDTTRTLSAPWSR